MWEQLNIESLSSQEFTITDPMFVFFKRTEHDYNYNKLPGAVDMGRISRHEFFQDALDKLLEEIKKDQSIMLEIEMNHEI